VNKQTAALIESVLQQVSNSAPVKQAEPEPVIEEPAFRSVEWTPLHGTPTMLKDLPDDYLRNVIFFIQRRSTGADPLQDNIKGHPLWEAVTAEADYRKLSWS